MAENQSKPIFVSHAVADKAIADKVVDLLDTAMGIDVQNDVFCTSLEGLKIPAGNDFKQFVKEQIQEPKIVLLLISQNYLASPFCLAEVGASWAMSHRIVPFLVPPIKFDDMKAVLTGIHALKIEDPSDWNEALAIFKTELKIDPNINRWERKRDEQLEAIHSLIPKQNPPPIVPLGKLQVAEEKLKGANLEIVELETKNKQLGKLLEEVKKLKGAKEVAKIELENLPAATAFEKISSHASEELGGFPKEIREAFYYHFRGESPPPPRAGFMDTDDRWDEIRRAVEDGYFVDAGEEAQLNENNPKVRETIKALSDLKQFTEKTPELAEPYETEHGHEFLFSLRPFWETNLSL